MRASNLPVPSARTSSTARLAGALLVAGALGLAGCSSGTTTTTGATSTTAAAAAGASTTTGAGGTTGSTAAGGSTATKKTVNANTATVAEIQAALEANGVSNAAKWAREVEEYRPYATDDPTFASLKKNLAKYNPSPEVLQGILASLTL